MKFVALVAALFVSACSGGSPTSPTPPITTTPPPVVVAPPVATPNPLLSDPRFDVNFYRRFVSRPLYRWTKAPLVYVRTVDETGASVDAWLVEQTAVAIINTTAQWTGGSFGVAGLERGTETREHSADWITVKWSSTLAVCGTWGTSTANGHIITMNHRRPECTCGPLVAKHELGHAMGYLHTDSSNDLMVATFQGVCDKGLSEREAFHARVAYSTPPGSMEP